jgi:lysozyme family protein
MINLSQILFFLLYTDYAAAYGGGVRLTGVYVAIFEPALEYVLKNEGGYVNDPADPGGATNMGITFKVAAEQGIKNVEQLKSMTKAKAGEIYRKGYWRFDGIADQRLATKLFDMAVNMGMAPAVEHLQCALYMRGADLAIDGQLGPKTLAAANSYRADDLLIGLCFSLAGDYRRIVQNRPASKKFFGGWLRRAKKVPQ